MTRRPIKTRGAAWVQGLARWLTDKGVTPNQISTASMVCAALAFALLYATQSAAVPLAAACFLGAALGIQLRLLCNLLDGIVAVEGGKSAPDGPFWNEAPDRVADLLILFGLGHACGAPTLGMLAAALAIGTAYLRELGRAEGMEPDFSGPFAKPQRMALATLAAALAAVTTIAAPAYTHLVLEGAVWIIALGTAATALLRSRRLILWLKAKG